MSDDLREVPGDNLEEINLNVNNAEISRQLNAEQDPERPALSTKGGKNYALFETDADNPETELVILPAPAVGPQGSTKICDGTLTIGGQEIEVTAFRLPA
jgi:hypothetical protein